VRPFNTIFANKLFHLTDCLVSDLIGNTLIYNTRSLLVL
jgi:hypothetical protein